MVAGAQFMHRVNHGFRVTGIHLWVDAVTEIEHVPRALTVPFQNPLHLCANPLRWSVQHTGIEITLQGDSVTNPLTRIGDITGPVETQRVRARAGYCLEPLTATFGKENYRYPPTLRRGG